MVSCTDGDDTTGARLPFIGMYVCMDCTSCIFEDYHTFACEQH